jgi:hypothetical protein
MKRLAVNVLLILSVGGWLALTTVSALPHADKALGTLTKEQWRQDLQFLAKELPRRHKNAFHTVSRETFEKAVADLDAAIPSLQDFEIVIGMQRIVAMIGDAHTDLHLPRDLNRFPLTTYWFGDDLRVLRTTQAYRNALGMKVVKIGDADIKDAAAKINSLVPHENEYWVRYVGANYFPYAEILNALKITPELKKAKWTFADDAGKRFTFDMEAVAPDAKIEWLSTLKAVPLYRQRADEPMWFTVLSESQTIYFNFKSYPAKETFKKISEDLLEALGATKPKRLVIDFRLNTGGDFFKGRALLSELRKHAELLNRGHLYVITGRATQSAAMVNAIDFRKEMNAILVGEPTGGRPNGYSENDELRLPNSQIEVSYSTKLYRFQDVDSSAVMPDKLIEPSWDVYPTGRDAVMEWILAQPFSR